MQISVKAYNLECIDDTFGHGDDEVYMLMVVAELSPQSQRRCMVTFDAWPRVASGEVKPINRKIWGLNDSPAEFDDNDPASVAFIVVLMESDDWWTDDFARGKQWQVEFRKHVDAFLNDPQVAGLPYEEKAHQLFLLIHEEAYYGRYDDDIIGVERLRITSDDIAKEIQYKELHGFTGSRSDYRVTFLVSHSRSQLLMRPRAVAAVSRKRYTQNVFALGPDGTLYRKSFDGTTGVPIWTDELWPPAVAPEGQDPKFRSAPTLAAISETMLLVAGVGIDGIAYAALWTEGQAGAAHTMTEFVPISGFNVGSIVIATNSPASWTTENQGRVDLFYISQAGEMFWAQFQKFSLDDFTQLQNGLKPVWKLIGTGFLQSHWLNPPPAAVYAPSRWRVDVFALADDSRLLYSFCENNDGFNWVNKWYSMGGEFGSPPTVVAHPDHGWRTDVFAVGRSDGALYHNEFSYSFNGEKWSGWVLRGRDEFTSPLTVVAWSTERLDVIGRGTEGQLLHYAWESPRKQSEHDNSADSAYWANGDLGGVFAGIPVATSWGHGTIDIFGIDTVKNVVIRRCEGGIWDPTWYSLGGGIFV